MTAEIPSPESGEGPMTITLPDKDAQLLKRLAAEEGETPEQLLSDLIRAAEDEAQTFIPDKGFVRNSSLTEEEKNTPRYGD